MNQRPTDRLEDVLPRAHDPRQRAWVYSAAGWDLFTTARNDPAHDWLARQGALHLQLWHPVAGISVLTPAPSTEDRFEVWTLRGTHRLCCTGALVRHLDGLGVAPPSPTLITEFHRTFVLSALLGVSSPAGDSTLRPRRGPGPD